MAFDDVVRVADLKTRQARFARVRREVAARPGEIVRVADYFKPRWAEMLGILPPGLAQRLERWLGRRLGRSGFALTLRSDAVHGLLALRAVAALRRLRPRGARYAEEQRRITAWLEAMERAAALGFAPVYEIALCARLIKGYGDTHARAHQNLDRILTALASPEALARWTDPLALAAAIEVARTAALADPEGKALDRDMTRHGMTPRPIAAKPVVFVKPVRT